MKKFLASISFLLVASLAFAQTFPVQNLQVNGTSVLSGNVSGAGVTNLFATPPAIGASAANTGSFTNLSISGTSSFGGAMSGAGLTSHDANVAHVQTVANVAALRALNCVPGLLYADQGYYTLGDGGAWVYTCNGSDTTSTDNGGTILAAANSFRLYANVTGPVSAKQFGAKCDGTTNDATSLTKLFATGLVWYIPKTTNGCLSGSALTIISDGSADGQLVAATGFTGNFVSINNPTYGVKLKIYGLSVYSTDVRPSPYTGAKTVGIYVGPTPAQVGVTNVPGVTLYSPRATRFSIGLQVATFNVSVIGGVIPQNDTNILVYTTDTTSNQVNDVQLIGVQADSAATSVGTTAYGLRVGTVGNGTYAANASMGVNLTVMGCNFDGAPVYIDNILGVNYFSNYHEQPAVYTSHLPALVIGSAGAATSQNIRIGTNWFTNFDYAIGIASQVNNLVIDPNSYASILYSAVQVSATETQTSFRYFNGSALGSTNFGSGHSEVLTNFSSGISGSQVTWGGFSIGNDYLNGGAQLAPATNSTTNWYPYGLTNDGSKNVASVYGRFRSGAAVQTGIAGTQSGNNFTFTTLSQAQLFNGGDRVTVAAGGGTTIIKSINYQTGVAVLDGSASATTTISHNPAYFIGYSLTGAGSPNTVVIANPGSLYLNTSGGANATLCVKESLTTSSGWVCK